MKLRAIFTKHRNQTMALSKYRKWLQDQIKVEYRRYYMEKRCWNNGLKNCLKEILWIPYFRVGFSRTFRKQTEFCCTLVSLFTFCFILHEITAVSYTHLPDKYKLSPRSATKSIPSLEDLNKTLRNFIQLKVETFIKIQYVCVPKTIIYTTHLSWVTR